MKVNKESPIRGYKVVLPDGRAKKGNILYEVGKEYIHDGPIKICNTGLHFCIKAGHCFSYYDFDPKNRVFEVEAFDGEYETHTEDSKICTSHLRIIRELKWDEVLIVANEGSNNTGYSNSGNRNSGYSNSGYSNSGDWNSGDWNSGDWNSGYRNSGYRNSGYRNSGYSNSGYSNSGDWNSGDWNSGYSNSGYSNSGNRNSGNRNSGDWNSGDWNSGYSNSGNSNSGAFCTITASFTMFNKKSKWTIEEFQNSRVFSLMSNNLNTNLWIQSSVMTDEEKAANPKYETTEGYLKTIPFKEAFQNMWHNLTDIDKKAFTDLPNFDWSVFTEITGVEKEK